MVVDKYVGYIGASYLLVFGTLLVVGWKAYRTYQGVLQKIKRQHKAS